VKGAEALVQTLISFRIRHIFNIPGTGMFPLLKELYRHKNSFQFITALNETSLTAMGDGYARASGRPAFVNVFQF
jgi:benzoylformate decarboxylase